MSLMMAGICSEGVVLVADSASTDRSSNPYVLTGYRKIMQVTKLNGAFGHIGDLEIEEGRGKKIMADWLSLQIQEWQGDQVADFVVFITKKMNDIDGGKSGFSRIFYFVGVNKYEVDGKNILLPYAYEINNLTNKAYSYGNLIDQSFLNKLINGESVDPVIASVGQPNGYHLWLNANREKMSEFVGISVPANNLSAVHEYIRFAVGMAGEMYKMSGALPIVCDPIHSIVVFKESRNIFQFLE